MLKTINKSSPLIDLSWIRHFVDDHNFSDENRELLIRFWNRVFRELLLVKEATDKVEFYDSDSDEVSADEVSRINRALTQIEFFQTVKDEYKEKVFQKLVDAKKEKMDYSQLMALQNEIENLTMTYYEESIYHCQPALMRLFINSDLPCAKDFLKGQFKVDKNSGDTSSRIKIIPHSKGNSSENSKDYMDLLTSEEKNMLSFFGPYTLEWLLIHVLSSLFRIQSSVRCASMIERIESLVRRNAHILSHKDGNPSTHTPVSTYCKKESNNSISYPFGTALIEFMVERGLIDLKVRDVLSVQGGNKPEIKKKKGYRYRSSALYVECKFDTSLLPMKLQLPMVCMPRDWSYDVSESQNSEYLNISSLSGGYLNDHLNDGNSLLSTGDISNFFLYFGKSKKNESHKKAQSLCTVMNKLQNQGFKINEGFLNFLKRNDDFLVRKGFLMPELRINFKEVIDKVRQLYLDEDRSFHTSVNFDAVMHVLSTNIQRARYERTVIETASAYVGYTFYLPAFLDFRGRIYRSGILHFHERDLARSLILFNNVNLSKYQNCDLRKVYDTYLTAGGFHRQSFTSNKDAYVYFNAQIDEISSMDEKSPMELSPSVRECKNIDEVYILYSLGAKNPFQYLMFLSGVLKINYYQYRRSSVEYLLSVPITQDASASAYQIIYIIFAVE
ncbi:orf670 (mitochondrion) [Beta vulgaris subsp. vulgaris]|uniref:Orf670 protein n=3 Tax=Beta TaxID=3554 RepID=Q9ME38_BETVV|nr:orf670 [Beta vulgaris subsp. vulgaris]NP_064108.1 orf670 [Beta vulgaris subsp. vulgaris]YP_004222296.1 hypothetical protein LKY74_mgp107 [Beta vulgaris subsp. maritima]YP_004222350.1 hypothetical protein LKY74_mgp048 [Beta vulgaris subsp. maritima]YP_004842101.1 hypothetical protein LKY79_mgp107 [Beta macrocarpa]YP_004842155.1 hypothetical protein LKY79_mgp050 [Beta macrocarpa]CBJ13995.1 hypothetical protein [Beta vulgaris subsp. maritima]CBJ14031.1 hypothetical protein [Beta vulgaris sub